MKKSMTVKELIKDLKEFDMDYEVFIVDPQKAQFDGVTKVFGIMSESDDKKYVSILANGDILKI